MTSDRGCLAAVSLCPSPPLPVNVACPDSPDSQGSLGERLCCHATLGRQEAAGLGNVSIRGGRHHRAGDSQKGNGWQIIVTDKASVIPTQLPVNAVEEGGKIHKGKAAFRLPTKRLHVCLINRTVFIFTHY